jgi:hypothetical protein
MYGSVPSGSIFVINDTDRSEYAALPRVGTLYHPLFKASPYNLKTGT